MSECQKCGFDPDALIENEMKQKSKVYNLASEPSYIPERAVPIQEAISIAKKYALAKLDGGKV